MGHNTIYSSPIHLMKPLTRACTLALELDAFGLMDNEPLTVIRSFMQQLIAANPTLSDLELLSLAQQPAAWYSFTA